MSRFCGSIAALSLSDKLRVNILFMGTESWTRLWSVNDKRYHRWLVVMSVVTSGGRCCPEEQKLGGRHCKMTDDSSHQHQRGAK